jgi:hypothetical protein
VYTNQADWLAAVSSLGSVHNLSLTPVTAVPVTGASYADDEGTLVFPDNHRGIQVYTDGWKGDVHGVAENPFDHEPHENHFTFNQPVVAFSATVWVGADLLPEVDSILLRFDGGAQQRLGFLDYSLKSPAFFGWVGDDAAATMSVKSGAGSYFYSMTNVEYVRPQAMPAGGPIEAVPLPKAAWGGLALLVVGGLLGFHRHRRVAAEQP